MLQLAALKCEGDDVRCVCKGRLMVEACGNTFPARLAKHLGAGVRWCINKTPPTSSHHHCMSQHHHHHQPARCFGTQWCDPHAPASPCAGMPIRK